MAKMSRPGSSRRHTIKAGVAVFALVAALSACGSNDKEKAPDQSGTPSQSTSPTPSDSTSATPS
ncbi:hypothetical protein ACIQNU_35365 [Streptomyces sp. NPDC091292]|uniref:hypothetical protein n=1 Tax=Streptomyces sp. NPDC091292 TaxID=3365991 RepID=UPI00380CE544